MRLNPMRLGLAGGIVWGVSLLILTLLSVWTGYSTEFLNLINSIYPGYQISVVGGMIGLGYGFLDGFVGLYIFAWLYNWLDRKS